MKERALGVMTARRTLHLLAAGAALQLLAAGSRADEQLTLPTPEGWRPLTAIETPLLRMSTFAVPRRTEDPDGVASAVDKLSFEWFAHGMTEDVDPFTLVEQVAGTIRQNCAGGSDQPVFAGEENGYATVVRLLACPRLNGTSPPRGELLLMKAIEGESGFWLVVRGRDLDAEAARDTAALRATIAGWSAEFREILLCDPDTSAHPCAVEAPGSAPDAPEDG